jgi:uncharacterized lipoprotein YmbA
MMRRMLAYGVMATLGVSLLGMMSGCASSSPTRLYVLPALTSTDTAPGTSTVKRNLTIGVGPVILPPYLDRPQIATRASRAQLEIAKFDLWASPLQDAVARTLADNLSVLVPTDRVFLAPWPRTAAVDYQVLVEVARFDGTLGGEVVLAARWSLADANGTELLMQPFRMTAPTEGADYEAMVMAMSRTLDRLSQEITATLLTLARQTPAR